MFPRSMRLALVGFLLCAPINVSMGQRSSVGGVQREYIVAPTGDFVEIDAKSMRLAARWNLRWVQGGSELFKTATAPDVFQIRSTDSDLYATIAVNGRDNPHPSWRLVRFSLPSFAVAASADLAGVNNLPILLSASHVSVLVGWNTDTSQTTLLFLNPATLSITSRKTIPKTIIANNNASMFEDTSKIIDGISQIDVETGTREVLPVFFALPAPQRSVLDKEFSTPDPATQKPFTSLGAADFAKGTLLVSASDPTGKKEAFWTFDLRSHKTSDLYVTTPAVARITPSGSLIVLQHTAGRMDSESTGSIEIIDTKTGESHKAHFSQLEGPLGITHLICVSDDSATFNSEDGIYIVPLPLAEGLTRINTNLATDKEQSCTVTSQ
jgi:hypothetical protein